MSTQDKLNYLLETKNQIKNAITEKGVEISDTDTFRSYADKINSMSSGSANIEEYLHLNSNSFMENSYLFNRMIKKIPNNIEIKKNSPLTNCFYCCENLTEIDLNKVLLNNSAVSTSLISTFYNCIKVKTIKLGKLNECKFQSIGFAFYNCRQLTEIAGVIDLINTTSLPSVFKDCYELGTVNLKNLNVTGLDLSSCTKLSHESLMYLINNLVETTTTKSITLGATNLAKLTDGEKAIATSKGWTLG